MCNRTRATAPEQPRQGNRARALSRRPQRTTIEAPVPALTAHVSPISQPCSSTPAPQHHTRQNVIPQHPLTIGQANLVAPTLFLSPGRACGYCSREAHVSLAEVCWGHHSTETPAQPQLAEPQLKNFRPAAELILCQLDLDHSAACMQQESKVEDTLANDVQ